MKKAIPFLIVVLILAVSFAYPQKKKPTPKVAKTADRIERGPAFETKPFNTVVDKLHPYFLGHDAKALISSLRWFAADILKGCDEFETTQKCQDRLNSMYDWRISKELTARDLLSFQLDAYCRYNADASSIHCSQAKEWLSTETDTGTYVGVNAFGLKKLIHSLTYETIYVATDKSNDDFILENIPPEQARKLMPLLRVLLIGDPLQPFLKAERFTSTPTITSPFKVTKQDYSIVIELRQAWLYDIATGEILSKQVISPLPQ